MESFGLSEKERFVSAILIPFHDVGIWTSKSMDYLEPSIKEAQRYIQEHNIDISLDLAANFIGDHHKLSKTQNELSEKLRKADLVDLSYGLIRFGIPRSRIKEIRKRYPYKGFQGMIFKKVLKHAIRHLNHPFPMLKM
jgi:hypothetical protein